MTQNTNSVVYSANESALSGDGAGFWSNKDGWTTFEGATQFTKEEVEAGLLLPISSGYDAKLVLWHEAKKHYASTADGVSQEEKGVSVRLTLDVRYLPNGENPADLIDRLYRMCERAIGEGMLTGDSAAEVEEYSMDVKLKPEPLDQDEVADFMLKRIENGDLALEDIPVRLATYGLMESHEFVDEMRERMDSGE